MNGMSPRWNVFDASAVRTLQRWLGIDPPEHLPRRVAEQIVAQHQKNDILTGWVQLAIIGAIGAFYLLLHDIPAEHTLLQPVPWAIGAYGVFTAFRLWMSYRAPLPRHLQIASVGIDVSILMITIWALHIQFHQPAAYYLKQPALYFIFVIIVLRGLSAWPGDALLAGLLAAAGWLILLGYAVLAPGGRDLLTSDHVTYANSLGILIGAEMEKIVAILMASALVSVAVARSRRLLYNATAGHGAAEELSRFFSAEVARKIVSSDRGMKLGEAEQREAAVMFIDLRGFTRFSAVLPAHELIALLREYQGIVVPIVERNGGGITTFLGDGIMATFGATRERASYAADALRATEQLLDELARWSATRESSGLTPLAVGIGVTAGPVTVGIIGVESRVEFGVIGDTTNRAAKLQNHAKMENVRALTTVSTLDRAVAQGYAARRAREIRRSRTVAGIQEPVDLVVLA